jgi:two-component system cell cycle sensor histidine kinase/response regulator CckA
MAELLARKLETILVVDDTDEVLKVVVSILEIAKFHVLKATSGPNALELAANHAGRIDLLLSDVQMPGMSGPDLGEALKRSRPDIHVMLMSGFTGENLLALNHRWAYIQKPFVPVKLLEMINVVLHTQPGDRRVVTSARYA